MHGTRSSVEAVGWEAAEGSVTVVEDPVRPGLVIVACHPEDEAAVFAAIESERPAGVQFVTVLEYPVARARWDEGHKRATRYAQRVTGRFRWFWARWYGLALRFATWRVVSGRQ